MKDVSTKPETLRSARATATLHCPAFCIELLRDRATEKGDALETARVAGIMAAKRTPDVIPLCHPLPLQSVTIEYELQPAAVTIEARVQLIAATGAEMEALTAASAAALTLYDMLKPHAGMALSIDDTRLLEKRGGKSQYPRHVEAPVRAAILVVADAAAADKADPAGTAIRDGLQQANVEVADYANVEEPDNLRAHIDNAVAQGVNLIVTVGGTGIAAHAGTAEVVAGLLERELPGIMETARGHGQRRTPSAMLERGVAGLIGEALVVTFPGSERGARDTLDALLAGVLLTLDTLRNRPDKTSEDNDNNSNDAPGC